MSATIDVLNPSKPKRVTIVASNPTISQQTAWPIGFWWSELVHPYWEFVEHGYSVEISSPEGGTLEGDKWSERVHKFCASCYEAGKVTGVICHATCILLKTRTSDGKLLVDGKTWTGFANSEEDFADQFVGRRLQPFRIEDEARKIANTNFIVASRFKPHALREGNLVTGQQQYSGTAAARLIIEALGV